MWLFRAPIHFSPYSLLTAGLLACIASIDIFLIPTLHVGVFLYPLAILTALWWGEERAVIVVTCLAFILGFFERWSQPAASYRLEPFRFATEALNNLASLLLIVLFGSACIWIARQKARYRYAQESLTDLEAKLTAVVQLAPDALVIVNADGSIVFWNSSAAGMFGYTEQEALGQLVTLIIPKRLREAHLKAFQRVCDTGETHLIGKTAEFAGLRKGDKEFPLEIHLATWKTKGTRFFCAFLRDLTERKRLETRQAVQLAISQVLMESETVEQAGGNILQAVGHLTDWEVGLIWVLDQRTNTLRCATVWEKSSGPGMEVFLKQSQATTFGPGIGLPGRVLASGEPDWITNVTKDSNFPRLAFAKDAGLRAAFAFPIKVTGSVLGVIEFFAYEVRPPDTGLLHTFADIGLKVGQFIERRRLADETALLIRDLQAATSAIPPIQGLLPICATCKRIRDEKGSWHEVDQFIADHSTAEFSHTICATCARQVHPDWDTE